MISRLVFPLILLSIIVGCNEVAEEDNNQTKGNLSIQLTDAPFPSDLVSEANVTINKIEIRKSKGNDGNPFMTLSEEEKTFNLLELTNGFTATLAEMEVDTGA
jgi:antitoxin component of MazEF toxin-antitoxin module